MFTSDQGVVIAVSRKQRLSILPVHLLPKELRDARARCQEAAKETRGLAVFLSPPRGGTGFSN